MRIEVIVGLLFSFIVYSITTGNIVGSLIGTLIIFLIIGGINVKSNSANNPE